MDMEKIYFPDKDDKEMKLNFSNIISFDTLASTEKINKKISTTPIKVKSNKMTLLLNKNVLNKETTSDVESTGNSENTTNKIFINNLTETFNKRYIDNKETDDNNIINKNENIKIRKDIYGEEIKKGGKHKISFADNAQIFKSRMRFMKSRHSVQFDGSPDNRKVKKMGLRKSIIDLRNLKYHKNINSENSENKIKKLVEIIDIQSYKSFNKINVEYPKENNFENQETVCCSSTCFIY